MGFQAHNARKVHPYDGESIAAILWPESDLRESLSHPMFHPRTFQTECLYCDPSSAPETPVASLVLFIGVSFSTL